MSRILSTEGGGVTPLAGRHPQQTHPWWVDTPPGMQTHPTCRQTQPPQWQADTPPAGRHPPGQTAPEQTPPEMATAADGTHPTGMHSCFYLIKRKNILSTENIYMNNSVCDLDPSVFNVSFLNLFAES